MSRQFNYPSLNAGGELLVNKSGRFIRLLSATGANNGQLTIRFPEQAGLKGNFEVPLNPGTWLQLPPDERFTEFFIVTPNALTDVSLIVADGIYGDDRLTFTGGVLEVANVGGNLNEIADGSGPVTVGAGATVSIAPTNLNRRNLFVFNLGSAPLYLRSDSANQTSALVLAGGNFGFVELQSEVFAYNPSGGAIDVLVSELV